jgi:PD-(D/E)XK nuclease superfamily
VNTVTRNCLWTTDLPVDWPASPEAMTVSTLGEIEACPLRWALGAASYPTLWGGRGYPPRVHVRALAGNVVHLVLETITKQLSLEGCVSIDDPKTWTVLKNLGGITKVVLACVERILAGLSLNPRAAETIERTAATLRAQAPEIRSRAQAILSRIRLGGHAGNFADGARKAKRGPLVSGTYPEIELRVPEIGWKGRVDLLVLNESVCEVIDFKTGIADESHSFQLQVYALLWGMDKELNPAGRITSRLVISYSTGDVEIPVPSSDGFESLKKDIVVRGDAACRNIALRPPVANPSAETCAHCGVRQLCDSYWTPETQELLKVTDEGRRFHDVEIEITSRHGPLSWNAVVLTSSRFSKGQVALLRTSQSADFAIGSRIRAIDASAETDSEDQKSPAIISIGAFSELYLSA